MKPTQQPPNPLHLPFSLTRLAAAVLALGITTASFTSLQAKAPVKIFLLIGQSNMQGHGEVEPDYIRGTLGYLVSHRPGPYRYLGTGAPWNVRDDVWIHYERSTSNLLTGNLTVGFGASSTTIGPELGFGWVVGDHYGSQILLIKTSWGGKSLAVDFRPPSSDGDTGFYYNEVVRLVRDATGKIATYFPDYDGQGYEYLGIGWHQGWNDRVNQSHTDEYEVNMANFIRDMRGELGTPDLPFVIATTGMTGWTETNTRALALMNAQLAVAQSREFQGNVFTVDTRDFWRPSSESPSSQSYHWNRNAGTYMEIGLAMGEAMTSLTPGHDYTTWSGRFPDADLDDPENDQDGDGLSNNAEHIWGLDPTNPSSRTPFTGPINADGTFQYSRRDDALTGRTFTVWTSPNLQPGSWTEDTGAIQTPGPLDEEEVETVAVTLNTPPTTGNLFVRIQAAE